MNFLALWPVKGGTRIGGEGGGESSTRDTLLERPVRRKGDGDVNPQIANLLLFTALALPKLGGG